MTDSLHAPTRRDRACVAYQGRQPKQLRRYGTRFCDCGDCQYVASKYRLLHCVCSTCQFAEGLANAVAEAHELNRCDACERSFWSLGRSNVCQDCWGKPLCRVCWRPWLREGGGIVCGVCVNLLAPSRRKPA